MLEDLMFTMAVRLLLLQIFLICQVGHLLARWTSRTETFPRSWWWSSRSRATDGWPRAQTAHLSSERPHFALEMVRRRHSLCLEWSRFLPLLNSFHPLSRSLWRWEDTLSTSSTSLSPSLTTPLKYHPSVWYLSQTFIHRHPHSWILSTDPLFITPWFIALLHPLRDNSNEEILLRVCFPCVVPLLLALIGHMRKRSTQMESRVFDQCFSNLDVSFSKYERSALPF